jgi:hypothetical protein
VARLIAALDGDEFAQRERASAELVKLGAVVEATLQEALATGPSAEQVRRLRAILDRLGREDGSPEVTAGRRVIEVLEHIGTPEARQMLRRLVRVVAATEIRDEARSALHRMGCGK